MRALLSEADEIFYGGAAGGGKSDWLVGTALTEHQRAIIFRREFPQLKTLEGRARKLVGKRGQWNGQDHMWRLTDGRTLEFGAVQRDESTEKYQGHPHDFIGFDEASHFTKFQFQFLTGWLRTELEGQRLRIGLAGNPPTHAEGYWIIERYAAWLDPKHPKPAKDGELRWYARIDDKDTEVDGPEKILHKGEEITPQSRTFIKALVDDNPYYMATGYKAKLQALPEPLRSQMLKGDFTVGQKDDRWQLIPTMWVKLAQNRWTLLDLAAKKKGLDRHIPRFEPEAIGDVEEGEEPREGKPMPLTAIGMDVSRGGDDQTVLSPRYGTWFGRLQCHPGIEVQDGPTAARLLAQAFLEGMVDDGEGNLIGEPYANVDVIGVGASAYDSAVELGLSVTPVNFAEGIYATDRSGLFGFVNMRAYAYWAMREALDPEKGDNLALPDDPELLADLTAPRYEIRKSGIQVESKEQIIVRIGRSPDKGDAIVLANLPDLSPRVF
jgi:hypothetical protein